MGKYMEWISMDPKDTTPKNVNEAAQIFIASEMGETNRLKRMELALAVSKLDHNQKVAIELNIGCEIDLEDPDSK